MLITAGLIVLVVKIIVLGWICWQTRKLAAIVYLIYLFGGIFIGTQIFSLMAYRFMTYALWFSGKDIASINASLTTTCESLGTIINDGLLIWVLWSLTGRYRR
jgi:hypothetical protein